jgi:hypothetical protein
MVLTVRNGEVVYLLERSPRSAERLLVTYQPRNGTADRIKWGSIPIAVRRAAREFFGIPARH